MNNFLSKKTKNKIAKILICTFLFQTITPISIYRYKNKTILSYGKIAQAKGLQHQTITFEKNSNRNREKIITIPNISSVRNISVDNGHVSYRISGNNLIIDVGGGNVIQEYNSSKYSKYVTDSRQHDYDSFNNSIDYNDGSYSGTLYQDGSSYSNTRTDYKNASENMRNNSDDFDNSIYYNDGDGYSGYISKDGDSNRHNETEYKNVSDSRRSNYDNFDYSIYYSDGDGYSGRITKDGSSDEHSSSYNDYENASTTYESYYDNFDYSIDYSSGGYSGTLYKDGSSWTTTESDGTRRESKEATWTSERRLKKETWKKVPSGQGRNGNGWEYITSYLADGKPAPPETHYYSDDDGYSGTLYKQPGRMVQLIHSYGSYDYWENFPMGEYDDDRVEYWVVYDYKGKVYKDVSDYTTKYHQRYSGRISKRVTNTYYTQDYSGQVSKTTTYYTQHYSGQISKSTTYYTQNYSGTVYEPGYDDYYKYTVDVDYSTDDVPPTVYVDGVNTKDKYVKSQHLIITATDADSGVNYITTPDGNSTKGDKTTYEVKHNGDYTFSATDNSDNVGYKKVTISNIDDIPPVGVITSNPKPIIWTHDKVTLNIKATDDKSGVKSITLPNGNVVNSDNTTYTVDSNGVYTFKFEDNVGNVSTLPFAVINIDKTAPSAPTINVNTDWTNEPKVKARIEKGIDDESGIDYIEYKLEGATTSDWRRYNPLTGVNVYSEGHTTIKAREYNKAGLVSNETTKEIRIDRTLPILKYIENNKGKYIKEQNISFSCSDSLSGINNLANVTNGDTNYINLNKDSSNVFHGTYKILHNGDYTFKLTDIAGNVKEQVISISNIDDVSPNATITSNPKQSIWTNKEETLNIKATDDKSGVKSITLPDGNIVNSDSTTYTVTHNGTYTFQITDNVGNTTTKTFEVKNIDTTNPTTPQIITNSNWTNNDFVPVKIIQGEDGECGINRIEYKLDGAENTNDQWQTYTGEFNINLEGITTIYARTVNNANGYSDVVSNLVKIDRTKPYLNDMQIIKHKTLIK